ncbi:MAG: DeoR family transcriptional regulator, partial [Chitinophagaceae bacterium]|nr:DeoR family transcriptional regulator [Chitinophagaceae bacterium]
SDHKKLMEDIPNKIKNYLGIIAEIKLHDESGKYAIEIVTPPYTVAVSLRGRYYQRSGSTNTELIGAALTEFLLRKSGQTWDEIIESRATIDDIDQKSVDLFLEAAEKSGRMPDVKGLILIELLEKLRVADGGKLKRAALILFGKDPGRFYPNLTVKMGRFGKTDDDLKFQETEEGNLIQLLQEVPKQLGHKFLIKNISFEGLLRIEKGEYPAAALREMLLNALVHRNYMGAMIQIRIYDNKLSIWNEGTLPTGITFADLRVNHPSKPKNPIIADVCFKGGYIDAWGRGTLKIITACREAELPEPEMKEEFGGVMITLFKERFTEEQLRKMGLNERQVKAVLFVLENGKITNKEYQEKFGVSRMTATRDLTELVEKSILKSSDTKGAGSYYEL